MNHSNLCRFVGIVVDEANLAIVSEFCPKGSLREFFQNESMVVDWTFKYSIINDIIAGLMYIHSSPLKFHGRLKSSNCLVSGRFVIKLTDYGPHTLLDQQEQQEQTDEWFRRRIWVAPEHMAGSARPGGSMMGDVYSFGLLLYEIISNRLPFSSSDKNDFLLPPETLYEALRANGPNPEIGPDMGVIEQIANDANELLVLAKQAAASDTNLDGHDGVGGQQQQHATSRMAQQANADRAAAASIGPLVDLMQACWQFEPSKRPTLIDVNSALKKLTRGVTPKKLLENLTARMEQYTNNLESLVEAKLTTLVEEKSKTEELLYQFVPKTIASRLREGQFVEPEAFECVTVFYSDIVGFTSLSSESSPMEVVDFLSELYLCFDETLEQHDTFKVDTIGDAYIVASGLPQPNDGKHVIEIAETALELRDRLKRFKIPHKPGRSLEMRVGIHSGPCVAGIVGGLDMPKYCVFGDTLTTGKFMESSGLPMKIHITDESRRLLADVQRFHIEPRVPKVTRDGLPYQTYWLERGGTGAAGDSKHSKRPASEQQAESR
jgi:atrial natriuretic peptide receptor A